MHYFEVALIKLKAPILTYSYNKELKVGTIVEVPLKGSIKRAVVLKKVNKPEFKTQEIIEVLDSYYSEFIIESAKFISSYYFSSLGEALGLFYPYKLNSQNKKQSIDSFTLPKLTPLQQNALNQIEQKDLSLLFGVTGSGKTEIYIHLIANALKENKSAILLMPEIALTPQITKRIQNYFGSLVATWHSKISKKKKDETLQKIYNQEIKVVIGARSALFLPLKDIGLIIVDEEHDDSYKSSSRPRYNAKDLSIYFGKKLNAKVVLGSATPLVSDFYKFNTVKLKKAFIESKKEYRFVSGESINLEIIQKIKETINKDEQALIFIPTRANFKYLICNSCGKSVVCPFCSIGMSLHSKKRALKCHYCNYSQYIPNSCSFCGGSEFITKREGTAEVAEILQNEIKNIKIEIFDKDSITTINKLSKALERVNKKEANVIIGTQMLSKGHDYPEITLSVITGLDFILAVGDYRAKERAIAIMHQIAGRSGRSKDATVLIQTLQSDFYRPYLKDYEDFINEELEFRKIASYPPFKNIARVLIANKDKKVAQDSMLKAVDILKNIDTIEIVGFGEAPIERVANKWRFNILLKSSTKTELLKALRQIYLMPNIEIDMDPIEFG